MENLGCTQSGENSTDLCATPLRSPPPAPSLSPASSEMSHDFRFEYFQAPASVVGLGHFHGHFWSRCGDGWPFPGKDRRSLSHTLIGRTDLAPGVVYPLRPRQGSAPACACACNLRHRVGAEVPCAMDGVTATSGNVSDFGEVFPAPLSGFGLSPTPEAVRSRQ